jgi:HK97 family phage major capsid protein
MPYSSIISRTEAQALIPEEVSREIIQGTPAQSTVLQLARRLPNMSRNQQRIPVLSILPTGYFVSGSGAGAPGLKQTSEVNWANKYLDAEEIAVIVPIPEAVLDDADYDIWGEIRPLIEQEFGRVIDGAVLIGTNAPTAWPDDLLTAATAAGHVVDDDNFADLYDAIMGVGGSLSFVEADGFMVNGHVAVPGMRARLRGLRDANGVPIFQRSIQEAGRYELDGSPIFFQMNGGFTSTSALMFSGDWQQLVYSIRQDITYKILDQAVITDAGGNIIFNLPQQDMVALRVVMRLAWQVPNPINILQPTEASRYPFAVLTD